MCKVIVVYDIIYIEYDWVVICYFDYLGYNSFVLVEFVVVF